MQNLSVLNLILLLLHSLPQWQPGLRSPHTTELCCFQKTRPGIRRDSVNLEHKDCSRIFLHVTTLISDWIFYLAEFSSRCLSLLKVQLWDLKLYVFHVCLPLPTSGSRNKTQAYDIACVVSNDLSTYGRVKVKFCSLVVSCHDPISCLEGLQWVPQFFLAGSASVLQIMSPRLLGSVLKYVETELSKSPVS